MTSSPDDAMMTALKAIYVQTAGSKHTVSGQKAWIRALAGTALHAAGLAAGTEIKRGGQVVTLWHGDVESRLLEEPSAPGDDEPLPAYVPGPGQGQTHRHGTDEPGWIEHSHMGGGVPHQHDADGYQIPV